MELARVANKLRKSLKAVALLMEAHNTRLTFDQLLSLCAESTPSQVGECSVGFDLSLTCMLDTVHVVHSANRWIPF